MVEERRRVGERRGQIDFDGVSLTGANSPSVVAEGEALLVVVGDDPLQQSSGQMLAAVVGQLDQLVDLGPTVLVERQADLLRLVPQNEAEEFAELDQIGRHGDFPELPDKYTGSEVRPVLIVARNTA